MTPPFVYLLAVMSMTYYHGGDPGHVNLYISGSQNTEIQIKYPWQAEPQTVILNSANQNKWNLTHKLSASDRNVAAVQGIRVESNKQITIQVARGKVRLTNVASYTAIHLTENSTEHFLSARANSPHGLSRTHPLLIVGAWEQTTNVSVYRRKGVASSLVFSEILAPYQVKEFPASASDGNLTGYYVTSDNPTAVYSGHQCGNVPIEVRYCEPILQQIPPVSRVGQRYVTGPLKFRSLAGYTVRVVFARDNTQLHYAGKENSVTLVNVGAAHKCRIGTGGLTETSSMKCTSGLQAGDYLEFLMSNASWPMLLTCSKNCYAYQFNHGGTQYDAGQVKTDPFMMLLQPLDLSASNVVHFSTITTFSGGLVLEFRNFINVVMPAGATFTLDGKPPSPSEVAIPVHDWLVYTMEVDHGFHEVSTSSGAALAVQVYGHGPRTGFSGHAGYGFPANFAVCYTEGIEPAHLPFTTAFTSATTTSTYATPAKTESLVHYSQDTETTPPPRTTTAVSTSSAMTPSSVLITSVLHRKDNPVKTEDSVECTSDGWFSIWFLIALGAIGLLVVIIICLVTALVVVVKKRNGGVKDSVRGFNHELKATREGNNGYMHINLSQAKYHEPSMNANHAKYERHINNPAGTKVSEKTPDSVTDDRCTYDDVVVPNDVGNGNTGVYDYINEVASIDL